MAWELLLGAAGLIATLIVIAWRAGAFFSELNSRFREISAWLGKFDGRLEDIPVYAGNLDAHGGGLRSLAAWVIEALAWWEG